ncbi:hypothetical protein [Parasitella parasitica]|uniref:Uncharacterized protein n=1 Tax=Parasitella parasitica TaxID=35722 RepID=A0A0B7NMK4_9FUNG|nr:hypothetical protein [Parasitella parasitica]
MAKQYETLVRENISSNYESRTCCYLLGIFSKPNHELYCGNILTVSQRKSIARYVFQKKLNAEDEMSEKQSIQESVPQQTATPGYVCRNLKAINGVTKVNLKTFNSLKEAVLVAINSNKP